MESLACEKVVGQFTGTPPNETGVVVVVGVLATGWAAYC
jgi:hypothetical protein